MHKTLPNIGYYHAETHRKGEAGFYMEHKNSITVQHDSRIHVYSKPEGFSKAEIKNALVSAFGPCRISGAWPNYKISTEA